MYIYVYTYIQTHSHLQSDIKQQWTVLINFISNESQVQDFPFLLLQLSKMACESLMCCVRLCAFILPSIILQFSIFFSPYWFKHNETSECFLGVTYNSGCPDNVEGKRNITSQIFKMLKHLFLILYD